METSIRGLEAGKGWGRARCDPGLLNSRREVHGDRSDPGPKESQTSGESSEAEARE